MRINQYKARYIDWKNREKITYIHAHDVDEAYHEAQLSQGFEKILSITLVTDKEGTAHGN